MEVWQPATGSGTRELDDAIRETSIVALILKRSDKSIHEHRKRVLEIFCTMGRCSWEAPGTGISTGHIPAIPASGFR